MTQFSFLLIPLLVSVTSSVKSVVLCTLQRIIFLQKCWSVLTFFCLAWISPQLLWSLTFWEFRLDSIYNSLLIDWQVGINQTYNVQLYLVWLRVRKKSQGTQANACCLKMSSFLECHYKILFTLLINMSHVFTFSWPHKWYFLLSVKQVTEMTCAKFN